MITDVLRLLSTDKYARLMPRIFSDSATVQLCDDRFKVVWQQSEFACGNAQLEDAPWEQMTASCDRRQLSDSKWQYRGRLESHDFGTIGWLYVCFDDTDNETISHAMIQDMLLDAALVVLDEIELQLECNQLAVELTERYEELNLVYQTNDQVQYFEEGHEALTVLARNCAESLDVDYAALIFRDRSQTLASSSELPRDLLATLYDKLYEHVEAQLHAVVINESDKKQRRQLLTDRTENVLAVPVIDDHGQLIGLLVAVARASQRVFSNGDRNLLDVMAKKASHIVQSHHDSLTGLMNRSGFESTVVAALNSARSANVSHCLLHIDMDQLHVVNDLAGHHEGDQLIRKVAKSLGSMISEADVLARLGSDEFGLLVLDCDIERGHAIASRLRETISEISVVSESQQMYTSVSIGVAPVDSDQSGIVGILANAEIACKSAKDAGRNRVEVFASDNTKLLQRSEEVEWLGRIQKALRNDEFRLVFQPVTPLHDDQGEPHYEVLIRLEENGVLISPINFLPAAERYQQMPLIDRWVIRHTLQTLAEKPWQVLGEDAVFCINLSGQSLTSAGFFAFVESCMQQHGIAPQQLCFEITETAAIANIDEALEFMERTKQLGCKFSLDDFGAGLSSFGYLKKLPVDYLKIDGSFIKDMCTDPVSRSMVGAICQIAETIGLQTVAEFVGDEQTVELLCGLGVTYGQGYYLGKPVTLDEHIEAATPDTSQAM